MKRLNMSKKGLLLGFVLVFLILCGVVGCAGNEVPSSSDSAESTGTTDNAVVAMEGEFVSDEQCLSCHGGSYEVHAETTSSYGDWNPHNSIHGGYNSCVNCHERDKELTDNQCEHCHAFTPGGLVR